MAEARVTHVLEVVSGTGEPPELRFTLGVEKSPTSVGQNGMWKVTAKDVLDAHLFVYFDGRAFFVQSANSSSPALANGAPVGTAWTEMEAPCTIEFGAARMMYREANGARRGSRPSGNANGSLPLPEDSTNALAEPPAARPRVSARPPGASKAPPPLVRPAQPKPPPLASSAPGPKAPSLPAPATSPLGAGPVVPQATLLAPIDMPPAIPGFTSFEDPSDSTRVAPLAVHTGSTRSLMPSPALGSGPLPPSPASGPLPSPTGSGPLPLAEPSVANTGQPTTAPLFGGREGSSPLGASTRPPLGSPPALDGRTSTGGGQGFAVTAGGRATQAIATWRSWSLPRKLLSVLLPAAFIGAVPMLFEEDPPPKPRAEARPAASTPAEAPELAPSAPPPVSASTGAFIADWPASVPCPPPNWPADRPPPCTPNGVSWPAAPATPAASGEASPAAPEETAAAEAPAPVKAAPLPAGKKTLERQAVDLYSSGDYLHAADKYDELAAENPSNRTYAEAARIARTRASGKAP